MEKDLGEHDCWDLVNNACTIEEIDEAEYLITKRGNIEIDVYHDMMNALMFKSREYYNMR